MTISGFPLTNALRSMGAARVFLGDPFTLAAMTAVPTEGEITAAMPQTLNRLTAPELTGDVAHDAFIVPGQTTVTVPVIYGGTDTLAKFSATGVKNEGFTAPQKPVFTSLLIVPLNEMKTSVDPPTLSYNGTAWDPVTPPVHALWFWKVVPQRPEMRFAYENGGKIIIPVTFEVFYDAARPAGHRVFTQGDPVAAGITTVRL